MKLYEREGERKREREWEKEREWKNYTLLKGSLLKDLNGSKYSFLSLLYEQYYIAYFGLHSALALYSRSFSRANPYSSAL